MNLAAWNLFDDVYDHTALAENWSKIDAHDCSPGRGIQQKVRVHRSGRLIEMPYYGGYLAPRGVCPICQEPWRLAERAGPLHLVVKGYCDEHGWIGFE